MASGIARSLGKIRGIFRPERSSSAIGDDLFETPPPCERYLEYRIKRFSVESVPGFGHQICNIVSLIEEAHILGRIPILPIMVLPALHNKGRAGLTRYQKYISLNGLKEHMDIRFHFETEKTRFVSSYHTNLDTKTSDLVARREQLVVREFENWNFFDAVDCFPHSLGEKDGTSRRWLNSFAMPKLAPSRRVKALAERVCSELDSGFVGLHVRRGDRASKLAWHRATSPEHIEKRLMKWVPSGTQIYLLSDEDDENFFEPLSAKYRIKTSFSFPDLRKILEEEKDNFMLFAVESEIMRRAKFCVSTEYFKGPVLTAYSLLGPEDLPVPTVFEGTLPSPSN